MVDEIDQSQRCLLGLINHCEIFDATSQIHLSEYRLGEILSPSCLLSLISAIVVFNITRTLTEMWLANSSLVQISSPNKSRMNVSMHQKKMPLGVPAQHTNLYCKVESLRLYGNFLSSAFWAYLWGTEGCFPFPVLLSLDNDSCATELPNHKAKRFTREALITQQDKKTSSLLSSNTRRIQRQIWSLLHMVLSLSL